jgi:hypothetical protein
MCEGRENVVDHENVVDPLGCEHAVDEDRENAVDPIVREHAANEARHGSSLVSQLHLWSLLHLQLARRCCHHWQPV